MKVVQLLPAMAGGGVEQGTVEIARALTKAGHESTVVSAGGRLVAALDAEGSRHVEWNLGAKHPATLLQVRRFRRWLLRERPDILHVRSRLPAWVAWLAWRGMQPGRRPRLVTTVHGLYSVGLYSAVMTRGERVIAVSETAKRYALANYPGLDPQRVVRIDRGVDPARFHKDFRPSTEWTRDWQCAYPELRDKQLVVLPGRLTRLKGHRDFIAAMRRLRDSGVDAAAVVVGDAAAKHAAYEAELKASAPDIVFTGHRSDVREVMSIADAVVSASTHPESFGRTVLEALSLGTPVVGYDHGGVGEILANVYPEGRVPVGDSGALAAKLADTLADPDAARRKVRDHDYDVGRMCAETLALYAALASADGG